MVHPVKAYLRDSRVCQQPAILVSTGKNSLISAHLIQAGTIKGLTERPVYPVAVRMDWARPDAL